MVDEKKINNDQKTQALKKPALQASIAEIEEQIARYKEFATFYEQRLASQKAELENAYKQEMEALREKAANATPKVSKDDSNEKLLSLSKFLCTAAVRRISVNESTPESRAFEGVLAQVYGGHQDAVAAMQKLIGGSDEKIISVEGETLEVSCEFIGLLVRPKLT